MRPSVPHVFNPSITEHLANLDADGFETLDLGNDVSIRVRYGEQAEGWLEVMSAVTWGWRFDDGIWRLTEDGRKQWEWARNVLRHPKEHSEEDVTRARNGLTRGSFPRSDMDRVPLAERGSTLAMNEIAQRFALPTTIDCPDCGTLNRREPTP